MKKGIWIALISVLIAFSAFAAENAGKFFENLLISDDIKVKETESLAKENASKMLDTKPKVLQMKDNKIVSRPKREAAKAETQPDNEYGAAPFGLIWGNSMSKTKNLGVIMTAIEEKDYVNSFSFTHLPKPIHDFRDVIGSFGIENELWRIIGYGKFIQDDAAASGVLKMYNDYYKLLEKKYGNAQQFYTPKVTNVDKTVDLGGGKTKIETEAVEEPIGGKNFLQELASGEAVLYSTFENGEVGVALAVNVDGDGQSYIIVDYKNLKILKTREEKTLDAL